MIWMLRRGGWVAAIGLLILIARIVSVSNQPSRYSPISSRAPPPEPTPVVIDRYYPRLWVCVDLTYGYAERSTLSPVLFQVSQSDAWYVEGEGGASVKAIDGWVQVRWPQSSSGRAWIPSRDLCARPPDHPTDPNAALSCDFLEAMLEPVEKWPPCRLPAQ